MLESLHLDWLTLVVLALATYRLSRLLVEDEVLAWLRERVWRRFPPSTALGYWFTCYWCTSIWTGSLLVAAFMMIPVPTTVVALALALSAVAGIVAARVDR